MNVQVCRDPSDAEPLYLPQRLYLKSYAKLNISIQLPGKKVHGKSISNWELMEKLRKMVQPDSFSVIKVAKLNSEVIRFDAELEKRDKLERVLQKLEDRVVKLDDYPVALKIKATEAKSDFPIRHSWDSFFRDARDMDEMKPGERPDTVHICNLPIRWFVYNTERDENVLPSESLFKKIFEKFGSVRQVDIPAADPFRMQMKESLRGISTPPQDAGTYFDAYVQFDGYVSFVRCLDALRGKKLLRKKDDIAEWCGLIVDFDKTKHMTDAAVRRRAIVRDRIIARERTKKDSEQQEKEKVAKKEAKERKKREKDEWEKHEKMREREERRKQRQLAKLMLRDDVDLTGKLAEERNKMLEARKKLQAIRLLEELFKRIEQRPDLRRNVSDDRRYCDERARERIVHQIKRDQEEYVDKLQEKYRQAIEGRIVIRSALETGKPRRDSESSLSSEEVKKVKREERSPARGYPPGVFNMATPYGFGFPGFPAAPYPYMPQGAASLYYGGGREYYAPPESYAPRRPLAGFLPGAGRGRGMRGRGRGRGRLPFFDGPDANLQYLKYFQKLADEENRNGHDDRTRRRTHSRSRSRSRRRSYTRSRSRGRTRSRSSRTRSRSRSRSRGRRSRRSHSRSRSRSRSHHTRSRSRSRRRSRSRSRHTRSRSKSKHHTPKAAPSEPPPTQAQPRQRSKSWSLPREGEQKRWSKSPKEQS